MAGVSLLVYFNYKIWVASNQTMVESETA